jgi:hypothetical protein
MPLSGRFRPRCGELQHDGEAISTLIRQLRRESYSLHGLTVVLLIRHLGARKGPQYQARRVRRRMAGRSDGYKLVIMGNHERGLQLLLAAVP